MTKVPSSVVDTDIVAPHERFPLWRQALAPTHEVFLPEGCDPNSFRARAQGWQLDNTLILESRSTPQRLLRSSQMVQTDQIDHYIVRLQKVGTWTGDIGDRVVTVHAGSVMVLDMARMTDALTDDIENINVVVPRDALDGLLTRFDMHGLVLRNGIEALLRSHLLELADNLPRVRSADARALAGVTLRMIAACLSPSRDTLERARKPLENALISEIRRYIDRHLHAPDLSPRTISEALGISRSRLYTSCAPMGGVAAFVQKRRLKKIHAILRDPRDCRGIAEIAYQFGFSSGAHFSRAFRQAFGYSPSEAREAAANRLPNVEHPEGEASAAYDAWIRQLGD